MKFHANSQTLKIFASFLTMLVQKNQMPQNNFNSLTMIKALDFEISYKSASVCKVSPVANRCNVKEILHSSGIQSLDFVYFLLNMGPNKWHK
jgi:hypothetical protein